MSPRPRKTPREPAVQRKTLDRLISRAGLGSRSEAAAWIRAGRVTVGGARATDPARWVDPERDDVRLDGRAVRARERVCVALHKPKGYVTTRRDPEGRPTVYDLLADLEAHVVPVGRLDRDTSGLLLLTNDTDLADRLTDPASCVWKVYRVEVAPRLDDRALEQLARGVELADGPTRPARVRRLRDRGPRSLIEIQLSEGRNREVRRMIVAVGGRVHRLERVAIGPLELGDLPSGRWRPLSPGELRRLRRASGAAARRASGRGRAQSEGRAR